MAEKQLIETVYGKYNKYEVLKDSSSFWGNPKFYIHKNGQPFKGPYSSLSSAVEAAKKEA